MKTSPFVVLRRASRSSYPSRVLSVELLENRIAPAFVASINGLEATLIGDATNEALNIAAAGANFAHNRFTAGDSGFASDFDFDSTTPGEQLLPVITGIIIADLGGGDDTFSVAGNSGVMRVFGGPGNDTILGGNFPDVLSGGPGNDFIDGQQGNDTVNGNDGDDVFQWDPGDGSDVINGNAGADRFIFNGSNIGEIIAIFPNQERFLLTRNVANITMDVGSVESLTLSALGGADVIDLFDFSSTTLRTVDVRLGAFGGGPDAAADVITVRGSLLADDIRVRNSAEIVQVVGTAALVNISGFDALGTATPDTVNVLGDGGVDNVVATSVVRAKLIVNTDGETENPAPPIFQLSSPLNLDVGKSPGGIAAGKLFELGNDLVIANTKSNTLSVFFDNGLGSYGSALQLSTGGKAPKSVLLEDFNGDGRLDIAVSNSGSGNVAILINNGDGTFATPTLFAVGKKPGVLRTADVNGDGITDLVTIVSGNRLAVLPGDGAGGFGDATTIATGGKNSVDFQFTDFNNDGRLDVAVANSGSNNVTILAGNADLSFAAPVSLRTGTKPTALALGDFNGDARPDLAVANGGSKFVSVLLNASTGGNLVFNDQLKLTHLGKNSPGAISVGDLDKDGRDDIVVGNTGSGSISVFLSAGAATFHSPLKIDLDNSPPRKTSALVVIDLNGDGRLDIATANSGTNDISLLIGLPS